MTRAQVASLGFLLGLVFGMIIMSIDSLFEGPCPAAYRTSFTPLVGVILGGTVVSWVVSVICLVRSARS